MEISTISAKDWHEILIGFREFWDEDYIHPKTLVTIRALHHHSLPRHFSNTTYAIRTDGKILAYLCGFYSQPDNKIAISHIIAVRKAFRGKGLANALYKAFISDAKRTGCKFLEIVTTTENERSIKFHQGLAERVSFNSEFDCQNINDLGGPDEDRILFTIPLS